MANDKIDLDSFDLDDFDFDIPEFQAEEEDPSSRKPVNRAVKGAVRGLKQEFMTPSAVRKALTMALPEGYGLAADTLDNIATDTRSLYDRIAGESPEVISGSKKFSRRAMNTIGNKILPAKLSKRINAALEDSEHHEVKSDADYRREQEDSELAALTEIFRARTAGEMEREKQEAVDKVEGKVLEQARFKSNIQALTAINRSMARLVGYQDKVTIRYQQKMLELNYRQAATSKQLLDIITVSTQKQQAVLENIRKNTALPEAVKIRGSEMFGQMARQRLMGSGLNTVTNWSQNYSKQVMDNISGLVQGVISPISQASAMGGDDIDKVGLGGEVVGSMIGSEIRDRASMAIAPLLAKNKTVARGNEKIRGAISGLPQKVNEWSQSSTQGDGYRSVFTQMLKDFLPKFILDSRAGGDSVDQLDDVATFDKASRRSLIEIIPGYLSEIAHWSRVAVTGEKDSEKQVYNHVRGGFSTVKEQHRDVSRQVMTRQERESLRVAADDFLKEIGGDVMSSKAQRVLKRKLLDELANGKDLVPSRLVKPEEYPGEDYAVVEEVTSLIADTFGLDADGKMIDNSTEGKKQFNDRADSFRRIASMIPAVGDRVRIFSDVLGKDVMRQLGFISRDKDGRADRVNHSKFWDSVFDDENESTGPYGTPQGDKTSTDRTRLALDRMLGSNKVSSLLSGGAERADDLSSGNKVSAGRYKGLERYLGEKSTLITILTESRGFHSDTVELLKQLTSCSCQGERTDGNISARVSSQLNRIHEGASSKFKQGGAYVTGKYKDLLPKFNDLKKTGKDIWIQGEDHPILQEWKMQAGHYKDAVTGNAIKKWEDIQGDVLDVKTQAVAKYRDLTESAVFVDKKGKVVGKVSKLFDKFRASRAGAMTAGMIAGGQSGIASLGNKVNGMRGTGTLNEFADNLGAEFNKGGKALKESASKFRPRVRKLMKFFTGGKAGGDVTSELTGDNQQDMLTLAIRSVQLQYETLKEVTQEKVRKGSMQDIWSRRKEIATQAKDKVKGKYEDAKGMLGKGGVLGGLLDKLGLGGDEEGGDGDTYVDMGGDGADDGRRRRRGRGGRGGQPPRPRGKMGKALDWAKRMGGRGLDKMGTFGKALRLGGSAVSGLAKGAWWATKKVAKGARWAANGAGRMLGSQLMRTGVTWAGRLALTALVGGTGLVAAPVLAAIGVVTGVVAIGSLIYGAMKDKLPLLARLRMIQYGIDPDPENKHVRVLAEMEKLASKHVKVSEDGKAELDLGVIPVEQIAKIFSVEMEEGSDPKENEHFMRMMKFLYGRFREVYLTHVSNYYVLTKSTDISQVDAKVVGKAAVKFVNSVSMKGKESILDEMDAPFVDEDDLEYDAGDVEDEYDSIKEDVIDAAEKGDSKTASEKHADAVKKSTTAAGGVAAAAASSTATAKSRGAGDGKGGSGGGGSAGSIPTTSKTTNAKVAAQMAATTVAGPGSAAVTSTIAAALTSVSNDLEGGKAVRYRVYGLTEMLAQRAWSLALIENALFPMVNYDKDKQAFLKDNNAAYKAAEAILSPVGDKEIENVYVWFYRRFLPAFLKYCSGVRMRANIDAREADTRLEPMHLLDVLKEMVNARGEADISVWDITESPWKGYVLNGDMDSVKDALYQIQLKVKDKPLQEPKTAQAGRVRGKDGELEETDPNQVNRPTADGSTPGGAAAPGVLSKAGSWVADTAKSAVDSIKSFFGGGDKAPQQGTVSPNGQAVSTQTAAGSSTWPQGTPVKHPGGGTGGSINDIPQPKGDGWENSRDTLMAAANMVGVDPALAASVAGVESAYRPNARPWSKKENRFLSSAASYYQVIRDTWKELMGKYAAKYGIAPETTQADPRANALLGLEYIRENIGRIKDSVRGRGITDTDVYLAHFLGPGGAKRFLSAPPGDPAINHVGADQASSNPTIFYNSSGQPRTVADVYRDFDTKMGKWRMPDAAQVASTLKGGAKAPASEEATAATEAAGTTGTLGSEIVGPPTPPSMVRATDTPSSTNTVADAPVTSTSVNDIAEKANARQTQNSTANMAMVAATADSQTSSQAAAQADSFGGAEKSLGRLIGVNEAQLEQLVTMVTLLQRGQVASEEKSLSAVAATSGNTGAVNSSINTPRPAPKGAVSVGRE